MDRDVRVEATAFFTVPGTVIAPFSVQMDIVTRATIPFGDLPVVHPVAVEARLWSPPAPALGRPRQPPLRWDVHASRRGDVHAGRGRRGGAHASRGRRGGRRRRRGRAQRDGSGRVARIVPYPASRDGLTLPLDTGQDSLFILGGAPDLTHGARARAAEAILLDLPDVVDVHRHPDVDEYILRRGGAGYILNGRTPERSR